MQDFNIDTTVSSYIIVHLRILTVFILSGENAATGYSTDSSGSGKFMLFLDYKLA